MKNEVKYYYIPSNNKVMKFVIQAKSSTSSGEPCYLATDVLTGNDVWLYKDCIENDWGIQFSHTLEEQIGGQLKSGFVLTDLYEDTNGSGNLHEKNIPSFIATRSIKR